MAGYGCARTFAQLLGRGDAANLLQESLNEEGAADKKLTKLALKSVNVEAAQVCLTGRLLSHPTRRGATRRPFFGSMIGIPF